MKQQLVVIDLFTGAGGLTEGFLQQGYQIVAHVEKEKWACETLKTRLMYYYLKGKKNVDLYNEYLRNANNYLTIEQDRQLVFDRYPYLKRKLDVEVINKTFGDPETEPEATSIKDIIGLIEKSMGFHKKKKVSLIIGGPPCQAYSIVGRSRMREAVLDDKRNFLFRYFKEIVTHFEPDMFVFENVPGLITAHNGRILSSIREEFSRIGYSILTGPNEDPNLNILDVSNFGINQTRKRLIIFGFRSELKLEYPNFQKYAMKFQDEQNTRNTIGDLPFLLPGEGHDLALVNYPKIAEEQLSDFQKFMRQDSIGIVNHKARPVNKDYDREIYEMAIEEASKHKQLRYFLLPPELKKHRNEHSFDDRFKVHWWRDMPHTIVAHISKDGHYNIHPDIKQRRSLTVREAARIQSFPDNFKFEGPRTWQFVQVGNAVPPLLARAIARAIKRECM